MHIRPTRSELILFVALALVQSAWGQVAASGAQERALTGFLSAFSQPVPRVCIVELGGDFAAQATFYDNGVLGAIRIAPKYFFHENVRAWGEPENRVEMSSQVYDDLLRRAQVAMPLGTLRMKGTGGVAGNSKVWIYDFYDGGIVENVEFLAAPSEIRTLSEFTVIFFRPVRGTIESKEAPSAGSWGHRVKVDGQWYWVRPETFAGLATGQAATIEAAGPQ